MMLAWKMAACLAAGNTVILKQQRWVRERGREGERWGGERGREEGERVSE